VRRYPLYLLLVTISLSLNPTGALAEDLLDFLFGSDNQQKNIPANKSSGSSERPTDGTEAEGGGAPQDAGPSTGGYCVRLCDGYYFPVIKSSHASRQESCEFSCPSSPVEYYDGGSISYARNHKGQRYSAQPFALAFKKNTVQNCSCNNPDTSQEFAIKMSRNDPTLVSGDIIIEENGAVVYSGNNFIPLESATSVSASMRQRIFSMIKGSKDQQNK